MRKILFCLLVSSSPALADRVGTSPARPCRALVRSPDGTRLTPLGKGEEREIATGVPGLRCRLDGARAFPGGQVLWPVSCWTREKSWEAALWSPEDTGPGGRGLDAGPITVRIGCPTAERLAKNGAAK